MFIHAFRMPPDTPCISLQLRQQLFDLLMCYYELPPRPRGKQIRAAWDRGTGRDGRVPAGRPGSGRVGLAAAGGGTAPWGETTGASITCGGNAICIALAGRSWAIGAGRCGASGSGSGGT